MIWTLGFFDSFFSGDAGYRLAFALGHVLWQGVAIAVAALLLARFLRQQSAHALHLLYVGALALIVACLPFNLLWVVPESGHRIPAVRLAPEAAASALAPQGPKSGVLESLTPSTPEVGRSNDVSLPPAPITMPSGTEDRASDGFALQSSGLSSTVAPDLGRTVALWVTRAYFLGLLFAGLRTVMAYRGGQRLSELAWGPDEQLLARFRSLASKFGFGGVPRLAILGQGQSSERIPVGPVVVGLLKPVVLLPAAALVQLTPSQLEAVLLHELAHLRRYDPYFLLFRRAVETLLFFHPAVWMLSRRAALECEKACDDLVLAQGVAPGDYADSLMHFARQAVALNVASLGVTGSRSAATLRHRLARLFGHTGPNALRLTRKGGIALVCIGLLGFVTAVSATRETPPEFITLPESIPQPSAMHAGQAPHAPLEMALRQVRPHRGAGFFTPEGQPAAAILPDHVVTEEWWTTNEVRCDFVLEVPADCPPLVFTDDSRLISTDTDHVFSTPITVVLLHRADGTPYVLATAGIPRVLLDQDRRFDLALRYFTSDDRGTPEMLFRGPFRPDKYFRDTTGAYKATFRSTRHPGSYYEIKIFNNTRHPRPSLLAYDASGAPSRLLYVRTRDATDASGRYHASHHFQLAGWPPERIAYLVFNQSPRTRTFRNLVIRAAPEAHADVGHAPYVVEMARRLDRPLDDGVGLHEMTRSGLTHTQALQLVDVARGYSASRVWDALRATEGGNGKRFADLDLATQHKIKDAANRWMESDHHLARLAGYQMGLWTGDLNFFAPALAYCQREGWHGHAVMHYLARSLSLRLGPSQISELVELMGQTSNPLLFNEITWVFRITGRRDSPAAARALTVTFLLRLAHHPDPHIWLTAIHRINENAWTLYDADGVPARRTVLPRLAAESPEMLRRCAIVVGDAERLGQPLPPADALRLDEVFTPRVWRMIRTGDFTMLYDRWIGDGPVTPAQGEWATTFLDGLLDEWPQSDGDGWSIDNPYIVERIVQHLNAVTGHNVGGIGSVQGVSLNRSDYDWAGIAQEAIDTYRVFAGTRQVSP